MARGSTQATGGATSAQNLSNTESGNAAGIYSTLAPQLSTEATNPTGYSAPDLAAINTAEQESAGGSQAGAVGQGALLNARTKNAGGADAAIAESTRTVGRNLSRGALQTQIQNANLKNQNQQRAISEEGNLYGTNLNAANNSLGEVAGNVNANTNAANASWDWAKYILDPAIEAAGSAKYPGT